MSWQEGNDVTPFSEEQMQPRNENRSDDGANEARASNAKRNGAVLSGVSAPGNSNDLQGSLGSGTPSGRGNHGVKPIVSLETVHRKIWANGGKIPLNNLTTFFDVPMSCGQFACVVQELCAIKGDVPSERMLLLKDKYRKCKPNFGIVEAFEPAHARSKAAAPKNDDTSAAIKDRKRKMEDDLIDFKASPTQCRRFDFKQDDQKPKPTQITPTANASHQQLLCKPKASSKLPLRGDVAKGMTMAKPNVRSYLPPSAGDIIELCDSSDEDDANIQIAMARSLRDVDKGTQEAIDRSLLDAKSKARYDAKVSSESTSMDSADVPGKTKKQCLGTEESNKPLYAHAPGRAVDSSNPSAEAKKKAYPQKKASVTRAVPNDTQFSTKNLRRLHHSNASATDAASPLSTKAVSSIQAPIAAVEAKKFDEKGRYAAMIKAQSQELDKCKHEEKSDKAISTGENTQVESSVGEVTEKGTTGSTGNAQSLTQFCSNKSAVGDACLGSHAEPESTAGSVAVKWLDGVAKEENPNVFGNSQSFANGHCPNDDGNQQEARSLASRDQISIKGKTSPAFERASLLSSPKACLLKRLLVWLLMMLVFAPIALVATQYYEKWKKESIAAASKRNEWDIYTLKW